jgi:hypothetical protein
VARLRSIEADSTDAGRTDRRGALRLLFAVPLAGLLGACDPGRHAASASGAPGAAPATPPPPRSADDLIRDASIAASRQLTARYALVERHFPALRGQLAPPRAAHARQIAVLEAGYQTPPPASRAAKSAPVTAPTSASAALPWLSAAESATSASRAPHIAAASGDLARLLASIAASEAAIAASLPG